MSRRGATPALRCAAARPLSEARSRAGSGALVLVAGCGAHPECRPPPRRDGRRARGGSTGSSPSRCRGSRLHAHRHLRRPFSLAAATRGKLTYLYFGYTHCPDACPATMSDLSYALRAAAAPRPAADRGRLRDRRPPPRHARGAPHLARPLQPLLRRADGKPARSRPPRSAPGVPPAPPRPTRAATTRSPTAASCSPTAPTAAPTSSTRRGSARATTPTTCRCCSHSVAERERAAATGSLAWSGRSRHKVASEAGAMRSDGCRPRIDRPQVAFSAPTRSPIRTRPGATTEP